jgi:hypothetical protein
VRVSRTTLGRVASALGIATLTVAAGATGSAAAGGQDPPGNNGTVKVDGVAFDDHPNNEPHPGCVFEIDFYGFDRSPEGETYVADVLFENLPPTPAGAPGEELLADSVDIGDDPAGGGTDLDAHVEYDLTDALAAIEPHPRQGWHVKLTVHADGSIGNDTKHKVFWIETCEPETTAPTEPETPETPGTSGTTVPVEPGSGSPATVPGSPDNPGGSDTTVEIDTGAGTPVPGETTTTVEVSGESEPEGDLPRTGDDTTPLVVLALVLVGGGTAAGLAAQRMRAGRSES